MKKRGRHIKKSSTKKSSSRKSAQHEHVLMFPFSFRRIVIVTTCIALFVFAFVFMNDNGRQSVAGINIAKGLFVQATVTMPQVENAVHYNIYYRQTNESTYKNAVRDVPPTVSEYTISYLSKDAEYIYKISGVDGSGAEVWWSDEQPLVNLQPM